MNKKGSHIGVIISFTLFVVSLIFTYVIIASPLKISSEKENSIFLLKNSVINEVSEKSPIVRFNSVGSGCVTFNTPENNFSNLSSFAVNINENEIPSSISGSNTIFQDGSGFVKIYFTNSSIIKSLEYSESSCLPIQPSSINIEQIIYEKKIVDFINLLHSNYTFVKGKFLLNAGDDFNVLFKYSNGTIIGFPGREVKIKSNVYAREYKISYISLDGKIKEGSLIIKIW